MDNPKFYSNKKLVQFCKEQLAFLDENVSGVEASLLATQDGFTITSNINSATNLDEDADKFSAVSSSLLALSMSLAKEIGLEKCKSVHINSETGNIFIRAIYCQGFSLVLLVKTNQQATLSDIIASSDCINEKVSGLVF